MSSSVLPEGRYLTCVLNAHPDAGGQTRAMLLRNRMFAAEGLQPSVLTFSANRDQEERRRDFLERGLLVPGVSLLNIYEHYRATGWNGMAASGKGLEDLRKHRVDEEVTPDGSPYRIAYRVGPGDRRVFDYLRADGTPFLRIPGFVWGRPGTWPDAIQQVSKDGEVVGEFNSLREWFRYWVQELTRDDDRAFIFIDSRGAVPLLAPMGLAKVHLLHVMHNIHVMEPRRWDSPLTKPYERVLNRTGALDALVTLTERQREDIAALQGETNNLFVVPNPVDLPQAPRHNARDPYLVTVVARLTDQKRLTHAIAAFAKVVEHVPNARLDIYGTGSEGEELQRQADRLGLAAKVSFKGYDPHARDALWRSSAFLMTSTHEGYPLATLESMSHGCPVVSYDIKYGPREQITDGVDGFVVPEGDIDAMADRVITLLKSPDLVAEMGRAAIQKANQHGTSAFVRDWAGVVAATIEQKRDRVRFRGVELTMTRVEVARPGRVGRLLRHSSSVFGRFALTQELHLDGLLRVLTKRGKGDLNAVRIELAAVAHRTGSVRGLPVDVRRDGEEFRVSTRVRLSDVLAAAEPTEQVRLRLRLVWANASWQAWLSDLSVGATGVEISYDDQGSITLLHRTASLSLHPRPG